MYLYISHQTPDSNPPTSQQVTLAIVLTDGGNAATPVPASSPEELLTIRVVPVNSAPSFSLAAAEVPESIPGT